jgi:hypothetical protein
MISFDLRCSAAHVFEVWFRSGADYEAQRARRLIACPTCGDTEVMKAVMAPNVAAKGNQRAVRPAGEGAAATPVVAPAAPPSPMIAAPGGELPAPVREALAAIASAQAEALPRSRWVGEKFAEEARAIHAGEGGDGAPIHGQTTPDEARALMEDGIAVMPLLVPFTPPDKRN